MSALAAEEQFRPREDPVSAPTAEDPARSNLDDLDRPSNLESVGAPSATRTQWRVGLRVGDPRQGTKGPKLHRSLVPGQTARQHHSQGVMAPNHSGRGRKTCNHHAWKRVRQWRGVTRQCPIPGSTSELRRRAVVGRRGVRDGHRIPPFPPRGRKPPTYHGERPRSRIRGRLPPAPRYGLTATAPSGGPIDRAALTSGGTEARNTGTTTQVVANHPLYYRFKY